MNVVHLTDSPFFGGPERQMLGLAVGLPATVHTTILCFRENASCEPFLEQLGRAGIEARMLGSEKPRFLRMIADVAAELRESRADVLFCHGYKADVLGWFAARRVGIPVLSVSRGWTAHTWKVRLNETLDRWMLHLMDGVVCVSEGQAIKVRRAGVSADRVRVIHNAVDSGRFRGDALAARGALQAFFSAPRDLIVVGVGRLSPEKGFDQLVDAARHLVDDMPSAGVVLIGDGPDRRMLEERVGAAGLAGHVIFAGFRRDVDFLLQGADVLAQSSYTEGLPNVVLEACASGIPAVATDVGGTGEVITDGINGYLVPAGDPRTLAARLLDLARDPALRQTMGGRGRDVVRYRFSFAHQSMQYQQMLDEVLGASLVAESVAVA